MPLAALQVGCPKSGMSEIYLFEYSKGLNYQQFLWLLNSFHLEKTTKRLSMTKQQLKNVLSLAKSDREREVICYTAVATVARKHFGLEAPTEECSECKFNFYEPTDWAGQTSGVR